MTFDEIRKEAVKFLITHADAQLAGQQGFMAGALWGARRMNEEAVRICKSEREDSTITLSGSVKGININRVTYQGVPFGALEVAEKIQALMPAEDEK